MAKMSVNMNDFNDILDALGELNFSTLDDNVSHVVGEVCHSVFSQRALLYALSVLYIFLFIIGLAANALVVWVNVRAERNRYETHLYILNLAIADLCVVATLPVSISSLLHLGHWPFGDAMCKITHLIFSVNLFSSIFFLTCMSVDRYLSVTFFGDGPSQRKRRTRQLICVGVWLLALIAALPETSFLQAVKSSHSDSTVCKPVYPVDSMKEWMVGIQMSFIMLGFAIPFPVITVFYVLLAGTIQPSVDQERRISRHLIFTYIVVFLVCWLPYHGALLLDTLALLNMLPFNCTLENILYAALHLSQWFSLLHCCVNPIIYNFINKNYRYDLMKAFIFKYSTKTGLARLIDASHMSETEYSAVESQGPL
ncbi:atypical chemokine receptor 3-like [Myxocyprinus asiaticus]|uniref:atypical chemokine receptor 3-like n=1 Tax=Myxocyprinus asiaticus TaxID=70543 RepID=UPI0022218BD1|nr:atypical chemokine receptor 3-like [Myxocyprinus asiaticus]